MTKRARLTALLVAGGLVLAAAPAASADPWVPASDMGSLQSITTMTGARQLWQAGLTGQGVDVAVIDTGVVPVTGLDDAGKIVNGADLSFESQAANLSYRDSYGHGTHMAGIVAGRDGAPDTPTHYAADKARFLGMAPDARLISVKVGDSHGAVDVSQVVAAIDWVVAHRNDEGVNIRVLNLSYGTDSTQSSKVDPIAHAVEAAWRAGIFVVVAAGNGGFDIAKKAAGLRNPARDAYVMAVGASDPHGTLAQKDDVVAPFSSSGCAKCEKGPDLVAPGTSVVSLRDPGSWVDEQYGLGATVEDRFFRGSGTSQAAAVVSGAAALVIQQRPDITPDALKKLLTSTATTLPYIHRLAQGAGELDLRRTLKAKTPLSVQDAAASTGAGSLEAARGSIHLSMDDAELRGEQDIFGHAVDTSALAAARTAGAAWVGGLWNGAPWTGDSWTGESWDVPTWVGVSWSDDAFTKSSWSGREWAGVDWSSAVWTGCWTKSSWSTNDWTPGGWTTGVWQGTWR